MNFSPHLSVIFVLCLITFILPAESKRSFGIQRRQKSNKSYSARRGGANSSPDHSPIPAPPKPAPQSTITKTNAQSTQNAPSPGWNVNNSPQGPPPAYPGLGHHAVPKGGAPPPYSPSYSNPPGYSPSATSYGTMGGGMPMGGGMAMGGGMPMGGSPYGAGYHGMGAPMYAGAPQKSGSGFSVGSLLMGMAAGHAVSSVVGGLGGGRRQYSETHIHHHYDNSKENGGENAAIPNEGIAPLITPDPVLLATPDQEQTAEEHVPLPPPMETIYSFNYAPGYTAMPQSEDSSSSTSESSEPTTNDSSAEATTTTENP